MLKKDIEDLQAKAIDFLKTLDSKANELGITLVSLQEGKMIFMDRESGVQVSADLVADLEAAKAEGVQSVESKASVGQPGIKMGKAKPH
jgi:hypothetical protein